MVANGDEALRRRKTPDETCRIELVPAEIGVGAFGEPAFRQAITEQRVQPVVPGAAFVDERLDGPRIERRRHRDDFVRRLRGGRRDWRDGDAGE